MKFTAVVSILASLTFASALAAPAADTFDSPLLEKRACTSPAISYCQQACPRSSSLTACANSCNNNPSCTSNCQRAAKTRCNNCCKNNCATCA